MGLMMDPEFQRNASTSTSSFLAGACALETNPLSPSPETHRHHRDIPVTIIGTTKAY